MCQPLAHMKNLKKDEIAAKIFSLRRENVILKKIISELLCSFCCIV